MQNNVEFLGYINSEFFKNKIESGWNNEDHVCEGHHEKKQLEIRMENLKFKFYVIDSE